MRTLWKWKKGLILNHMYTLAVLLSLTHDRYKHAFTPTLINPITQTQPRTHTQTHAI